MERIKDNLYFLMTLANTTVPVQRRSLVEYANRSQILALAEIVLNYLLGNIKLPSEKNQELFYRHRRLLRILGHDGRLSWIKRRQAAVDLGKVLVLLLKEILATLTDKNETQ